MAFKWNISKKSISVLSILSVILIVICLFNLTSLNHSLNKGPVTKEYQEQYTIKADAVPHYKKNQTINCLANTADVEISKKKWSRCLEVGTTPEYYLSIVIVTRIDNYAGGNDSNQFHRFQNFIDSAYLLAEHSEQKIELLIIEWNPEKNKRRVLDAVRFRRSKYLNHRIITVSNKIHKSLPNKGNSPLHEFEGKNVGIRFARGEYIVCTNQDDIWSHNFINAIKSRVFEKDTIYTQYQAWHNIHEDLPPSIVKLEPFPNDETLYQACRMRDQDWGNYQLPPATPVSQVNSENYWYYGDQAGDFTMAHRDTWKACRGYRETGGVAWVDMEFILTAIGTFDMKLVYSGDTFACHQEHPNEWEKTPERHTPKMNNTSIDGILNKKVSFYNEENKWGLQQIDLWKEGLECIDFQGGLCS